MDQHGVDRAEQHPDRRLRLAVRYVVLRRGTLGEELRRTTVATTLLLVAITLAVLRPGACDMRPDSRVEVTSVHG